MDMDVFQRTGKNPQKNPKSWQKISWALFLQFSKKPSAALQQSTTCNKQTKEPSTDVHGGQNTPIWVLLWPILFLLH